MPDSWAVWGVEVTFLHKKWDIKVDSLTLLRIPALLSDLPKCETLLPLTTATMNSSLPPHKDGPKPGAHINHSFIRLFLPAILPQQWEQWTGASSSPTQTSRTGTEATWSSRTQREAISDTSTMQGIGALQHCSLAWHRSQEEKPRSEAERDRHRTNSTSQGLKEKSLWAGSTGNASRSRRDYYYLNLGNYNCFWDSNLNVFLLNFEAICLKHLRENEFQIPVRSATISECVQPQCLNPWDPLGSAVFGVGSSWPRTFRPLWMWHSQWLLQRCPKLAPSNFQLLQSFL